jgi:hypothetical protein
MGLHCAVAFAAEQGYDLKDYMHGGLVADWWGFTWPRCGCADPGEARRRVVQVRRGDPVGVTIAKRSASSGERNRGVERVAPVPGERK